MTSTLRAAAVLAVAFLYSASAWAADLKPWTGGPAPPFELKDLQGATHKLEAYRGKVVVINFWATWCEPCREEMPSFNRLRKALEGRPVVLLAVNYGEGPGRITPFLAATPVDFPVLLDADSRVAKAWNVRLMPSTFIVGPEGRVRYFYAGGRDWSDAATRDRILALVGEPPGR